MNLAFYIHRIDGTELGGAEIATQRLAYQLVQRDHKVTLLVTQSLRELQSQVPIIEYKNGCRIIRLPVWQRAGKTMFARLVNYEAMLAFQLWMRDIQLLHMRKLDLTSLCLGETFKRFGVKTLCVPMCGGSFGDVATFPAEGRHNPLAFDWVSALTEEVRREVIEWGYPSQQTGVIPNGVDVSVFAPGSVPRIPQSVVYVGRFRQQKGVDLLLEAWRQVQSTHPDAQLTLIGGADKTPVYRLMAEGLGISPTFIEHASSLEVRDHLRRATIFVLPSFSEGMSNALLEAMSVGLAPLVSNVEGNRAVVTPDVNGLVFTTGAVQALATQLRKLLDNSALCYTLGEMARQTTLEKYSLNAIADQYIALYEKLLHAK